jgi:hypothetical protein
MSFGKEMILRFEMALHWVMAQTPRVRYPEL